MKTSTQIVSLIESVKSYVLLGLVFLFPLFFIPTTQEFFITNKLYLLAFGSLFLLTLSTVQFLFSKKVVLVKNSFDTVVLFFLTSLGLSVLFSSPNKVQALLNPNFGIVEMISLSVLYFYLSRLPHRGTEVSMKTVLRALTLSAVVSAALSIAFFLNPLKAINLPPSLQYLKSSNFTTAGSILDLLIFTGFFMVVAVAQVISKTHAVSSPRSLKALTPTIFTLLITGIAFALGLYTFVLPLITKTGIVALPPFSVSWYAVLEVLKHPMSALFGAGVDNYASVFAKSKDVTYNQSSLWQLQAFNLSRSTFLHVFSEAGVFGIASFALLIAALIKETGRHMEGTSFRLEIVLPVAYLLVVLLILPPSLFVFFLLFVTIANLNRHITGQASYGTGTDLTNLLPFYVGGIVVMLVGIGASFYLLGRAYAAEYTFKKALNGVAKNDLGQYYYGQRDSIMLNPYIESHRINFSQTNLLVANNTALKANGGKQQLTDQDRQLIANAIQAAIAEAKAVVALNPQKAGNWESLAIIYRNVLNVAQGADLWTISAYQRAVILDPQNPIYRLQLGGVYYSLQNYEEASKVFEQATGLKPDWPNAHYNAAWASFQKSDYQRAVSEMQAVISLLDAKKDSADYQRAVSEMDQFKAKLPKSETATPSAEMQPQQLSLPTPPTATVSPKLRLPTGSSPESR